MSLTTYDSKILNSLFTDNEFNFLKNIDLELEKMDEIIASEKSQIDSIEVFLKKLPASEKEVAIKAKESLNLINQNILLLQANRQEFSDIDKSIVDLLIGIESNTNSSYMDDVANLKNKITSFSGLYGNLKTAMDANNLRIAEFTSKYLVETAPVPTQGKRFAEPSVQSVAPSINYAPTTVKEDSNLLVISEKTKKVYLPYSKNEVIEYMKQYPDQYKSFEDVIKKEFINPLNFYQRHPVLARFREAYSLIRDREGKSVIESIKFAMDIMFNYSLNPAIVAACKTQEQLEKYLSCLEKKKLDEFKEFEIRFDVAPSSIRLK